MRSWFADPRALMRAFPIAFLVYFGTFATANLLDSLCTTGRSADGCAASWTASHEFTSAAVNIALCVYKDGYFARLASKTPVPALSYTLFAARDTMAILASTQWKSLTTSKQPDVPVSGKGSLSGSQDGGPNVTWSQVAEMASPVAAQLVGTPIHLMGIDIHNRRGQFSIKKRLSAVRKHLCFATSLRMARTIPVFGIGITVNAGCRGSMLSRMG